MRNAAAEFCQYRRIGFENRADEVGSEAAVTLAIEIVGRCNRCHGAGEIKLARMMAPVKLSYHRMILVKIGLCTAKRGVIRRQHRAIEPFIRMQRHRQHAIGAETVKNPLVQLGFALT